jgi:hypothetical protein
LYESGNPPFCPGSSLPRDRDKTTVRTNPASVGPSGRRDWTAFIRPEGPSPTGRTALSSPQELELDLSERGVAFRVLRVPECLAELIASLFACGPQNAASYLGTGRAFASARATWEWPADPGMADSSRAGLAPRHRETWPSSSSRIMLLMRIPSFTDSVSGQSGMLIYTLSSRPPCRFGGPGTGPGRHGLRGWQVAPATRMNSVLSRQPRGSTLMAVPSSRAPGKRGAITRPAGSTQSVGPAREIRAVPW